MLFNMADLSPLPSTQDSMRHIGLHSILARHYIGHTILHYFFLFFISRRPILFMKYT